MELDLLRRLDNGTSAPVVSVHLDTSREDEDADKRLEPTWCDLRRDLSTQGVDEATLDAVEAEVGSSPHIVGPQGESRRHRGARGGQCGAPAPVGRS